MSAAVQDPENENFGKVLEDQDLVAVRNGASLVESLSTGKQVKVTAEWISGGNSAVDGGGALQEGDTFFKRSRFTLYANVKFDAAHDNTSALLVGSDARRKLPHCALQDGRHSCAQGQQRYGVQAFQGDGRR